MGQIYYTDVCNVANKVNIIAKIYSIYGKLHQGHLYVQGNISLNILNLSHFFWWGIKLFNDFYIKVQFV